jgi:signal transduction histidine kinase
MRLNIKNISSKYKIYGIFIVSFSLFFGFAVERMWLSYGRYKALTEVYEIVRVAPVLSKLIQELQKERGATVGYLSSARTVFLARLTSQRKATNGALADFSQTIARDKERSRSPFFRQLDFSAERFLPNLDTVRGDVLLTKSAGEQKALYYTNAIRYLLDMIKALNTAGQSSYFTADINAYISLLEIEELAGQERALGVLILAADTSGPAIHDRFIGVVAKQKAYFDVLVSGLNPRAKARINALNSVDKLRAFQRARHSISQQIYSQNPPELDAQTWFDLASKRAELFHAEGDALSRNVAATALEKSYVSLRNFWILVAVTGSLGLVVAIASIRIARALIRSQALQKKQSQVLSERYKNLDAVSHLAVFETDQIGRIYSANETGSIIQESAEHKAAKGSFIHLVSSGDREKVSTLIRSAAGGISSLCEFKRSDQKGSAVYSACFFPLTRDRASAFRVMIVAEDITLRLASEAALLDAMEKAEVSAQAKNNFIANMNHELRTPLNHILGFSQILSDSLSDPEHQEWLGYVKTSAKDLLAKIDVVVELTGNDTAVKLKQLNLANLVGKTIAKNDWATSLKDQHKTLILDFPLTPVEALCDPWEIEKALNHVLDNAAKFTGLGDKITIEVGEKEQMAFISVTDSGRGISAEHLVRVTEPFEIVDDSYTRDTGGMGLGLAASKRLVQRSGGNLDISSILGEGTKVCLSVPLASCENRFPVSACQGQLNRSEQQNIYA